MSTAPLICTSVAATDLGRCREELGRCSAAEIRLDALPATPGEIRALFGAAPILIATCRRGTLSDDARRERYAAAIDGGAAYVDLALDDPAALRAEVIGAARARGCPVILSHHDRQRTPDRSRLLALRERCFDEGGDLAKIACWIAEPADGARLLGLLDDPRPTVVVGMGPLGRVVRVAAPLLGSPIAYVRAAPGAETAPGQLDRAELARLLGELGHD